MSDDSKPKVPEEKKPAEKLVDAILPDGGLANITNVLGGTEVDTSLDDLKKEDASTATAPTPSAIPKRPEGDMSNGPQPAPVKAMAPMPTNAPSTIPSLQSNAHFEASAEYSKPPIFGSRIGRMISMGIGLALVVGMVVAIVYFLTSGRSFVFPGFSEKSNQQDNNTVTTTNQGMNAPVNAVSEQASPSSGLTDTDGDGLLDSKEDQIKTDPKKIDTDGDELTDRQEIEIYKTSPLKKDTDADGFSDGAEVRNFYNPNGDGELLNVSQAIDSISNTNTTTNRVTQ